MAKAGSFPACLSSKFNKHLLVPSYELGSRSHSQMDECRKNLLNIGKLFSCVGIFFSLKEVVRIGILGKVKFRHQLPKILLQSNIQVIVEIEDNAPLQDKGFSSFC